MSTQLFLDIPGVGETSTELRCDKNVFQNQVYTQRNGIVVYIKSISFSVQHGTEQNPSAYKK